jgi:6-phosphogluconolactonase (cycloisomerase 2 family)
MHNKLPNHYFRRLPGLTLLAAATLALSACGGGGSDGDSTYNLGGTVSALTGSGLILKSNGQTLSVPASATTFSFGEVSGSYSVTVLSQPSGQTCSVSNASGSSSGTAVSSVAVVCRAYMLYVADQGANAIAQFVVGSDGTLAAASTPTVATTYAPDAIVVSDDGAHAWVGFQDDNGISTYATGSTGLLGTASGSTHALSTQDALALGVGGTSLYAAEYGAAEVSQFTVSSSGVLPTTPSNSVAAGVNPGALAVTADGNHLYVVNTSASTISGYSLNSSGVPTALTSNATTSTSSYGTSPRGIAVSPSGGSLWVTLSASAKVVQYTVDASTGALTYAQSAATGTTPRAIAVTPSGSYAYVVNYGSGTVSQYTLAGGSITPLSTASVAAGTHPMSISISPDGAHAYVTNSGDNTISQYAIGSGGALTALSPATVSSNGAGPVAAAVR